MTDIYTTLDKNIPIEKIKEKIHIPNMPKLKQFVVIDKNHIEYK
jgi:hypothetical protein